MTASDIQKGFQGFSLALFRKVCSEFGIVVDETTADPSDMLGPSIVVSRGDVRIRIRGCMFNLLASREDMVKLLEANAHRLLHPEHWGARPLTKENYAEIQRQTTGQKEGGSESGPASSLEEAVSRTLERSGPDA